MSTSGEIASGPEMRQRFTYRALTVADMDEAKRFVYEHFSKELPLRKIFKVKQEDIGRRNLEQTERMINSGTSFGCFYIPTGKLVGISQCCVLAKGEPPAKLKCEAAYSPELAAMARFCDWIMDGLFAELKAERLLLHSCGAVAASFGKRKLLDGTAPLSSAAARRLGCQYEVALAGNAYSARNMRQHGVSFTRRIAYSDWVDPLTGEKPDLDLCPVHTHAMIAYRKVGKVSSLQSNL